VPADRASDVVARAAVLLKQVRALGVSVIHVLLSNRWVAGRPEPMHNPFWQAVEAVNESLTPALASTISGHNPEGSPQTQLMPALGPEPGDFLVTSKRRLSIFLGTDLDMTLRELGVRSVVLVGINTNTCVQCAAFEACNRDLATIVLSDCVASMYGDDLHFFGLQNVARCLGWVLTADELMDKLGKKGKP
jgi:nicotinamidase-related amidase